MATPDQIRAYMRLHKLTQEQLAAELHRSRATIARILAGQQVQPLVMQQLDDYMATRSVHHMVFDDSEEATIARVASNWGCTTEEAIRRLMAHALRNYMDMQPPAPADDDGAIQAAEPGTDD